MFGWVSGGASSLSVFVESRRLPCFMPGPPLVICSIQIVFCSGWQLVPCLYSPVTPAASREHREDALGWILLLCEEQGCLINTLLLY